ncbi:hypothetical protein NP493_1750g00019 [Ridgeia piscesae]|uniref:Uncharacterized protein n=1 Tax=Ridgeia piscesae TaxID=27915 RepID=A0AAD9JTL2_RIDPI|nr:hypothetical protein NP493_1750g00019 [Ridgeia piscesae]
MLYHRKSLHFRVTIRPVEKLPSGAVTINTRSNKVIVKRSNLKIGRLRTLLDIKMAKKLFYVIRSWPIIFYSCAAIRYMAACLGYNLVTSCSL